MIVIWATWYVLSGKGRDGIISGVITTGVIYADTKAGVAVVHDIPLKSSDGEHPNINSSEGVTALGWIGFAVIAMALAAPRHQRQGLSWLRIHHSGSKKLAVNWLHIQCYAAIVISLLGPIAAHAHSWH
ncbi:hypothetical protein [Pseudomonas sp. RIT623]|uniref:hypothetical protein n=1 Tax=Pseudomonas sp. RIT623 TaxID=2559075 RepID=UPI001430F2F5|nr:hypothetical protein [Pseudomonas sp. RIT623]